MKFEIGSLYVTENCEYMDGCVFEFTGRDIDILKFKVIKPNKRFEYTETMSLDAINADRLGFKPLISTHDDANEYEQNVQEDGLYEKLLALEEYCGSTCCEKCVLNGKCLDWEGIKKGNQVLYEDAINEDYEKVFCKPFEKENVERVNHPAHYNQGIEAIEYIESHKMNFCEGNVVKYLTRAKYKGTYCEDLLKAKWYLDRLIQKGESND